VHASMILNNPASDLEAIAAEANRRLEAHQRIRSWSVWPDDDFPRTPSTMKIKRGEVARRVAEGLRSTGPTELQVNPGALSSLERVDLLTQLEQRYGVALDEEAFTKVETTEELHTLIDQSRSAIQVPAIRTSLWTISLPIRLLRRTLQQALVLPLFRHYIPPTAAGLENLTGIEPPVIFAANHTSHLDAPAIFAALPPRWRRLIAPAAMLEHFRAFFDSKNFSRKEFVWAGFQYALAGALFNVYPLPQQLARVRQALKTTGDLVSRGYCPLVFPEGERTPNGKLQKFQAGIGLMAVRLKVAVVPIYIKGLYEIYSVHDSWPKRGPVTIAIGPPLEFAADTDYADAAGLIEAAIRRLGEKLT
jgi:long-chain acyl-CoA synthetase